MEEQHSTSSGITTAHRRGSPACATSEISSSMSVDKKHGLPVDARLADISVSGAAKSRGGQAGKPDRRALSEVVAARHRRPPVLPASGGPVPTTTRMRAASHVPAAPHGAQAADPSSPFRRACALVSEGGWGIKALEE